MKVTAVEVEGFLAEVRLQMIWKAELGYGTALRIEAGEKQIARYRDGQTYHRGAFHLWIDQCSWRVRRASTELFSSDELPSPSQLHVFIGNKLRSVDVRGDEASIQFSKGISVDMDAYDDAAPDDVLFRIYSPSNVLEYTMAGFQMERVQFPAPA